MCRFRVCSGARLPSDEWGGTILISLPIINLFAGIVKGKKTVDLEIFAAEISVEQPGQGIVCC